MDHEKLGVFFLGAAEGGPFLYESRDLLTHAVVVGMTGSGKTGLGVVLLEEAAIDGIPALVIDPKGDLANLALQLDPRTPAAFAPWVDAASRAGLAPEAFAAQEAGKWAAGVAASGQAPDRIDRLRAAAEVAVYTPGASVRPLSVVSSFACPPAGVLADAEALRTRLTTAVSALLALVGVDADPMRSREHVLLSLLLERAWRSGQDLDLGRLVAAVHQPAMERVGALPLETFFPAADRNELVIRLNSLLASPAFGPWLEGEPLDVASLLYREGRARIVVLSLAHLGDAERMFFVSLLLGQVVGWMRSQPGTGTLRAVLYMDEVAGYLPPVANPPSKAPFLTLLKQARAYGLGLVLATQNPVDLDYKALSNAGTWFVGRLRTERDKLRLLDGLEGLGVDRAEVDRRISALAGRHFVVHDVHAEGLVELETRFALSYLRGPMTLAELARLAGESSRPESPPALEGAASSTAAPVVAGLSQLFLPALAGAPTYRAELLGVVRVHVEDDKLGLDHTEDRAWALPLDETTLAVDWARAVSISADVDALDREPAPGATFAPVPGVLGAGRAVAGFGRGLVEHAFRSVRFELARSRALGVVSRPGESEDAFAARLADRAHEERDRKIDALRERLAPRLRTLDERIARARAAVDEQAAQATQRKVDVAVSFGATLFGAMFGTRGSTLGRATTAARGVGRAAKESADVGRADEKVAELESARADLVLEVEDEADRISSGTSLPADLETVLVKPKKGGLELRLVAVLWRPS